MRKRPLDEFETAALKAITEHSGCASCELQILLGRVAVYNELRLLLGRGIVRKKRFPGEDFNRYYALSKHPPGSRLRKGKPILTDDQAGILRVVKGHPGSTGWEIKKFAGGISVSGFWLLPYLVRRKLIRKEEGVPFPRYYPV